jgi:gas vesicle protein
MKVVHLRKIKIGYYLKLKVMNSNQKFWSGIIVGAAAGAAIAMFLSSDKGKEVMADAKDTAEKLGSDLKTRLDELEKQFRDLMEKGKAVAEEAENKVAETIIS